MKVRDLRPGDRTPWYEVLAAPEVTPLGLLVQIRYRDGGIGYRTFDDPEGDLPDVVRPETR